jgi:hypothetical protein
VSERAEGGIKLGEYVEKANVRYERRGGEGEGKRGNKRKGDDFISDPNGGCMTGCAASPGWWENRHHLVDLPGPAWREWGKPEQIGAGGSRPAQARSGQWGLSQFAISHHRRLRAWRWR